MPKGKKKPTSIKFISGGGNPMLSIPKILRETKVNQKT